MRALRWAGYLAPAVLILTCACGFYSTTSRGRSLTGSIAIPFFDNRTTQPDLEVKATSAIVDALEQDGSLAVVSPGSEEFLLAGAVTRYSEAPFSISAGGVSEEYKLSIVVVLSFTNQRTGESVWRDKSFTGTENFFFEGSPTGEVLSRDNAEEKAIEQIVEDVLNAIFGEW
jgi:hypothetical protein